MAVPLILYTVLAAGLAFFLAFFQYGYKKSRSGKQLLFLSLRFITYLALFLLLINPGFTKKTYVIEKPELVIAVDNSASVALLETRENILQFITDLKNNEALNERFRLQWYSFGNTLNPSDSLSFTETQTHIAQALQSLNDIYKNTTAPTLLLTDGNQTLGTDYQYASSNHKNPVFPVILGDTTAYTDLSIRRINVNRYAYVNNRFPVEIILTYDGEEAVNSRFSITSDGRVVHTENISFSGTSGEAGDDSKVITVEIPATRTGVQTFTAEIAAVPGEKNTGNNTQFFAVEVIDEKARIAIVSDIAHPDIGVLTKIMAQHREWEVMVDTPAGIDAAGTGVRLFIFYQPGSGFRELFNTAANRNINTFIITGPHTDWTFLNGIQQDFSKNHTRQTEEVQAEFHPGYLPFLTEDIGFGTFPPLQNVLGNLSFSAPADVLLYQKIGNVVTQYPLLATFETNAGRRAALFGEGLWKWRMEHFRNTRRFEEFDVFFGKLFRYLLSDKQKERLTVSFESFYYGNSGVKISAGFFDKNYVFSPRASLEITVRDKVSGAVRTFPMLLKNRSYEADMSALPASEYSFSVTETKEKISSSGTFRIIAFDVEKQFLNADVKKLRQLAANTGGTAFSIGEKNSLLQQLLDDERFIPVQKSTENVVPLIDWKYLLIIIILSLSAEWFLRKYNGLV